MAGCAGTIKRAADAAVAGLITNRFRNADRTCVCTNRVLAQRSVVQLLEEKLVASAANLKLGNGLEAGVTPGPLITKQAAAKVAAFVDDAKERRVLAPCADDPGTANFGAPVILRDAKPNMQVFSGEIFDPVIPLFTFNSEAEALALANTTPHGLATRFCFEDHGRIWRMSERLESGMVSANRSNLSSEIIPLAG